jgi:hypothetical protein
VSDIELHAPDRSLLQSQQSRLRELGDVRLMIEETICDQHMEVERLVQKSLEQRSKFLRTSRPMPPIPAIDPVLIAR